MSGPAEFPAGWRSAAFGFDPNPSFVDLVRKADPGLLPRMEAGASGAAPSAVSTGTTILAFRFDSGVLVAGDRRATEGNLIADRKMEKVFHGDDFSAVAIAGAAGPALDMVRMFQLELEHYEKLEGERLSLDGKANRLALMIKQNFPLALQGLIVVPLFGGYDLARGEGRMFRYDAVGGRYEDTEYHATGSGGVHARGSLKRGWREGLTRDDAVRLAVEAILDASEEDNATGGPDLGRDLYPVVATVTAEGYRTVETDELREVTRALLTERGRA